MTAHYYPQLDFDKLSFEEFAFWSENALWVHSQMLMVQQANTIGMLGGGSSK